MDWLLESHLMDIAVCLGLLVACLSIGTVMQWLSEVETAKPAPQTKPSIYHMRMPCDHCGRNEGELLSFGIWRGDGPLEGQTIESEFYVLCRHCREQSYAECVAVLDSKLTVGG